MIKRFKSQPLTGAGYLGSILRDHHEEERARSNPKGVYIGTFKKFPYLWASCDWCGTQAYLDDDIGKDPEIAEPFCRLLNWCTLKNYIKEDSEHHFCSYKCLDRFVKS